MEQYKYTSLSETFLWIAMSPSVKNTEKQNKSRLNQENDKFELRNTFQIQLKRYSEILRS